MRALVAGLVATLTVSFVQANELENITNTIKRLQPAADIQSIDKSPVSGLYQVRIKDFDPLYVSADGRYFISGDLMQMTDDGKVKNLAESKMEKEREDWFKKIPVTDQIVFAPNSKSKATLYVFTDVECGYCRKFHTDMSEYNAMGVEIHYLAYPRGGVDSESAKKMQNVWCSKDRQAALTKVKAGGDVPEVNCSNAVTKQYNLGKTVGVKGTPAIFTPDGVQIGGYLSPDQMKTALHL